MITSLQNPRVKDAVHLRDRPQREKRQRILIDGARELRQAIAGGVRLLELFVCESLCAGEDARLLMEMLPACGAEVLAVNEAVFEKLAFGHRAEGVLGVAEMPRRSLENLSLGEQALVAVLEGVEKPGNIGAVLRSADGAGVSALIVADGRTDLYNPNAIRASLGTIFALGVCTASARATLDFLRDRAIKVYAARVDGALPYTAGDYRGPAAFVFGSETAGLSSLWSAADVTAVRLPLLGMADSLNVAATAAVLFYEALRQRSRS
ncbi:MAG: TrmH family RNA methyltransferase [Thermoguttaceae bacterium]|jgi:TrmH family RNA methyltransferase